MVNPLGFISYNVKIDEALQRQIERASAEIEDLRPAFRSMASYFYRGQKSIFKLKTAGGYPDFKVSPITLKSGRVVTPEKSPYKKFKERHLGTAYPLLRFSGALEASVTSPNDSNSIFILEKQSLTIGSSVPYLVFHQSDEPRRKMPLRKVLFISSSVGVGDSTAKNRLPMFLNILNDYVLRSMGATPGEAGR